MADVFQKDFKHANWEHVFAKQKLRAPQVTEWLDALGLVPGSRVLDVGAGPGYVSLEAAARVGSQGLVIAVDNAQGALEFLERLQTEQGVTQIRRLVADAAQLTPDEVGPVDAVLVTMMLHHLAGDPAGLLANVVRLLRPGGRAVVAEFHPEGACRIGAPRDHRIGPNQAQEWCQAAGLVVLEYRRQTDEHYMLVLSRPQAQ